MVTFVLFLIKIVTEAKRGEGGYTEPLHLRKYWVYIIIAQIVMNHVASINQY